MTTLDPINIGWILGDQLDRGAWFYRPPVSAGGSGLVRYKWVSNYVNAHPELGVHYSLYRPWRRYDGLIFQKAMGAKSLALMHAIQARGKPAIFDSNVNYYECWGEEYYEGMRPTLKQSADADAITRQANAVVADSQYLEKVCGRINKMVCWVPDNVQMELVPPYPPSSKTQGRLRLLWSGQAVKLFELLLIEKVLEQYRDHIELVLITNSLDALNRWRGDAKQRFFKLLNRIQHRIIPFKSIDQLFNIYGEGGIMVSPRYLDNAYNMGHTEWKVTLAMACGRIVLCSPVPSYVVVQQRAKGAGIRVCSDSETWEEELDSLLDNRIDRIDEERAAKQVVETYYATPVVAKEHAEYVRKIMVVS